MEKDEGDRDWWLRQFSFTPQNTMSSSRRRTVYRRYSDLCYAQTRSISSKIQKHHIISQLIEAEKNRRTHLESLEESWLANIY